MGFLNHSTNNIIIDAVLTERGRELLSRNDNSFKITQFSFGDDEVDYTNITKYGRIIGKEKIEKNTPIFEASTNENIALKNKLINLSSTNTRILFMPYLEVYNNSAGSGSTLSGINLIYNSGTGSSQDKEQDIYVRTNVNSSVSNTVLDDTIVDRNFMLKVNSEILDIKFDSNSSVISPIDIDQNKIATYRISLAGSIHPVADKQSQGLRQVGFYVTLKSSMSTETFNTFGSAGDATKIKTSVQIIGDRSNARKVVPVQVSLGS